MRIKHHARRGLIAIAGGLVIITGLVLVPLPGPGWVIVFIGLAILSSEFAWAERWLQKIKDFVEQKKQRIVKSYWSKCVDKHHKSDKK